MRGLVDVQNIGLSWLSPLYIGGFAVCSRGQAGKLSTHATGYPQIKAGYPHDPRVKPEFWTLAALLER